MKVAAAFQLPETFWRISVKALIFDTNNRLLVFKDKYDEWEVPGGGWDHGETIEQCIRRELAEEAAIKVASIGEVAFCYKGLFKYRHVKPVEYYPKISIAVKVKLDDNAVTPTGDDLVEVRFVNEDELPYLPFQYGEESIKNCVNKIWQ